MSKEVFASELYSSSGFKDNTFRSFVNRFMDRNMPGLPMDLLDTEDPEKWQVHHAPVFKVKGITVWRLTCDECGEEYNLLAAPERPRNCCENMQVKMSEYQVYAIYDTDNQTFIQSGRRTSEDFTVEHPGEGEIAVYQDDRDAERDVESLQSEWESESHEHGGFPWMHGWGFQPDRAIKDEELHEAGFTVATYDKDGDPYRGGHRLAGIDGCGYDFCTAHWAPLVVIFYENRKWEIDTDQGSALVTRDERSTLEKLADISKEQE